jgi:hypothetical protein
MHLNIYAPPMGIRNSKHSTNKKERKDEKQVLIWSEDKENILEREKTKIEDC